MIYLDYSATTPVDPRVVAAMTPYFSESFGNPSSVHRYGQVAEAAVDSAREQVASILNCSADEIIWKGDLGPNVLEAIWAKHAYARA